MQRFVYSPKAFVYVISKNEGAINLSDFVVSGEVHRKVDQLSTATVTIRNPNRQFTKPGTPTFLPMDLITIFLQRLPGAPIQTFTGYLDSAPYFQMYPGTCTLTASCTLKRLQYTYFDPGTPFTRYFMAKYGWISTDNGILKTAAPKSDTTQSVSASSTGKIYFFGDSLSQGTAGAANTVFKNWDISQHNVVGWSTASALAYLQGFSSSQLDALPQTVIVQLGTNDDNANTFKVAAKKIMQLLGKDRRVIWNNVYREAGTSEVELVNKPEAIAVNKALRQVADQYQNLQILDYASQVVDNKIQLGGDGLHPTNYEPLAKFVYNGTPTSNSGTAAGQSKVVDVRLDSNVSELLFATLKHIGGWNENQIIIEKLPPGLLDHIQAIYQATSEASQESSNEFAAFLKKFIGEGGYGGGASGTTDSTGGSSDPASGGPERYRKAANKYGAEFNIDPALLMGIAQIESGFGANIGPSSAGAMGPMQFMPATWKVYGLGGNILNPEDAVRGAANYLHASGAPGDYHKAIFAYNHAESYVQAVMAAARKYGFGSTSTAADTTTPTTTPDETKTGGKKATTSTNTNKIYAPIDPKASPQIGRGWHESSVGVTGMTDTSGHLHWHSGVDVAVPAGTACIAPADGKITMSTLTWSDGGMVWFEFTQDTGDIKAGTTIGWGHIQSSNVSVGDSVKGGQIIARSGNPGGGPHVHFIQTTAGSGTGGDGSTDPVPLFKALQKGETVVTTGSSAGSSAGTNAPADTTGFDDALRAAKAGGLAASFNFPTAFDQAESLLFKGNKSLMNDQALLPFINELAMGTMRHFMSLPNGAFYAFHPDYFGGFGTKPYWEISDVEILEGNIQLSDEALATHVFVTGATTPLQQVELFNKLTTAGVIHLFNAGLANFLNLPEKATIAKDGSKAVKLQFDQQGSELFDPFFGDMESTIAFLQRYGARPNVEEKSFIRSHIFETFYAFQKFMLMWSRQFLTTFTFTFMPELYPGGTVAFPDHGIRCYIEEVHHSFDYTSGFVTRANLSAPASTGDNNVISRGMVDTQTPIVVGPGKGSGATLTGQLVKGASVLQSE